MDKAVLFVDNEQNHINTVGTCPGISTLKIPSIHMYEPLNEFTPDDNLSPEGLEAKRFMQLAIGSDDYDYTSGIQQGHVDQIVAWASSGLPDKKVLFDFDRTLSMCEGIVCLKPKHGALFKGLGIANMRLSFPDYDITAEGFINYLCGGTGRVDMLKSMFNTLYENNVAIYVLTNNECCISNLQLFQEFMSVLTGGRAVEFICSYSFGGNKKRAIQSRPELAAACRMPGGYRPTRRNRAMLRRYKAGKKIGFTGRASLKAKGLLPRANGRYVLGPKYSGTGKNHVLTRRKR